MSATKRKTPGPDLDLLEHKIETAEVCGGAVTLRVEEARLLKNATLQRDELADMLEKAADTLRDAAAAYHFFGKHLAAEAMEIAEKHSRAALAKAGQL